jgi:hypothetical protein
MKPASAGQRTAEVDTGPGGAGENALVIGAVARGEPAEGPNEVGDSASALGEDRGNQEQGEAARGGPREDWGEDLEQRQSLIR